MKQLMIDMMTAMMPFMRPLFLGTAMLAAIGLLVGLTGMVGRGMSRPLHHRIAGLVLIVGLFFVACELLGRLLGFEPTLLFAHPLERAMYRNQWPFWMLGIGLVGVSILLRRIGVR